MVDFANLDLGYDQCRDIYTIIKNDGDSLLSDLKVTYDGLCKHWIGTDATNHINHMVDVFEGIDTFVAEVGTDMAFAADKIVEVQQVRRSNGSQGKVGESLQRVERRGAPDKIDDTVEYNCVPEASNDLRMLINVCEAFDQYVNKIKSSSTELLQNWRSGNQRDKVQANINKFEEDSVEFKKVLTETRTALETAIANISSIMD